MEKHCMDKMNESVDHSSSTFGFEDLIQAVDREDRAKVRDILRRWVSNGAMSFSQMDDDMCSTLVSKINKSSSEKMIMECFLGEDSLSVFGHKLIFIFTELQISYRYSKYLLRLLNQIDSAKNTILINNFMEDSGVFLRLWRKNLVQYNAFGHDYSIKKLCSMLVRHCCGSKVLEFMDELLKPNAMNECSEIQTSILSVFIENFGQFVFLKKIEELKGVTLQFYEHELKNILLNCLPVSDEEDASLSYTKRAFLDDHTNLLSSYSDILRLIDCINRHDGDIKHLQDLFNILCNHIIITGCVGDKCITTIINPVIWDFESLAPCSVIYSSLLQSTIGSGNLILVNPSINWEEMDRNEKNNLSNCFSRIKTTHSLSTMFYMMTTLLKKLCNDSFVFRQFAEELSKMLMSRGYSNPKCADFLQSQLELFTEHVICQPRTLQYLALRRVQQRMPIEKLVQPVEKQAELLGVPKYVLVVPPIFTSDGFNVATKLSENLSEFIAAGSSWSDLNLSDPHSYDMHYADIYDNYYYSDSSDDYDRHASD